ncbi:HAMP domain-containing histidine kinase [Candidatus Dojkabacteria bacterium]|uniref:histidine kinase n=1 Tax=Candidatus Dojkabacteria bacterium TaxID=2099670 RepID=A0A955L354_9BACT|nr:HAMP domain-containing histidine kinase [Candidatus Dojkabacteria bacterium]
MRSLKFKFTITVAVTLTVVLAFFSAMIFIFTVNNKSVIVPENLVNMPRLDMGVQRFLHDTERLDEIANLVQTVEENQKEEYIKVVGFIALGLIFISSGIAYLVATLLVRPIEQISQEIKKLDSEDLSKRVDTKAGSEEIEFLQTSFNKLLDNIEATFKSQEQFIHDAAHELRTPIASIKASIDALNTKKSVTKDDYVKLIVTIQKLNEQLVRLNEELLFLHRETLSDSYKKKDANTIVEEVIEALTPLSKERGVKLISTLNETPLYIKAHETNLSRAIQNIIENSINYSREIKGSFVEVKTSQVERSASIVIEDNGIGISKKDLDMIFERFYRAENARYQREGDGLGLAIVKKIVEDHKGTISIESKLHKGTTVTIDIPLI